MYMYIPTPRACSSSHCNCPSPSPSLPQAANSFHMPDDYTSHTSFNTTDRVRRSPSPPSHRVRGVPHTLGFTRNSGTLWDIHRIPQGVARPNTHRIPQGVYSTLNMFLGCRIAGFHLGGGRGWMLPSLGAYLPSLKLLDKVSLLNHRN